MTFAHPYALLWGLAAIAAALLYWLRDRPRRESVATSMFWDQVFAEERARSRWQPWRHRVSAAVQILVLLLVAVALAEPRMPPPAHVVLILDNSAAMTATDVSPSRLAMAKEAAAGLIESLHDYDEMAILSPGNAPAVHVTSTGDRAALLDSAETIAPADGPARMRQTLALARDIAGRSGRPGSRIVILSDGCFDGAAAIATEPGVEWLQVGARTANAAITRLAVRRAMDDPVACQVFVELRNLSDQPADCRLEVAFDQQTLGAQQIRLAPNDRGSHVFEMRTLSGGDLTAELSPSDAYPADNTASVVVPPVVMHRVSLPESAGSYLRHALEADPTVLLSQSERPAEEAKPGITRSVMSTKPDITRSVMSTKPGITRSVMSTLTAIAVFEGQVPDPLPEGPALVVNPSGSCDLWRSGDPLPDVTVASQADDSPLLAGVRLADVYLPGACRLEIADKARGWSKPLLATADGTPLAYAMDRPAGRVVVLSGDLAASNLVMQAAFPVLVANALDWLGGAGCQPAMTDSRTDWQSVPQGEADWQSAPRAGDGLDLRTPAGLGSDTASVSAHRPGPPLWLFPAGLALALIVVEWCLYQRRWIS